ncbi:hypothetical protein ABT298_28010 [Streptomyces sp. NPDC001034]|uniref:hypothetical protein n=1 Tax=Streptomyces sp. NPDC001034 TaxID=3154375 RepID=UPI00332AECCE
MTDDAGRVLVRRAGAADIDRLVEFRALMMSETGEDVDADPTWRGDAAAWFARRMKEAEADTFAAFVAELPGAGVVGCAVGTVDDRAPSPRNRSAGAARSPMSSRHRTSAAVDSPAPA